MQWSKLNNVSRRAPGSLYNYGERSQLSQNFTLREIYLIVPWDMLAKNLTSNFQANFNDWWLMCIPWNSHHRIFLMVQVMASRYLSQNWSRSVSPYGVTSSTGVEQSVYWFIIHCMLWLNTFFVCASYLISSSMRLLLIGSLDKHVGLYM